MYMNFNQYNIPLFYSTGAVRNFEWIVAVSMHAQWKYGQYHSICCQIATISILLRAAAENDSDRRFFTRSGYILPFLPMQNDKIWIN